MYHLKRSLADSLLEAAKNVYPHEFIALIGSKQNNEILDDLILVPATYGDTFSQIDLHAVPVDFTIKGSVHSHPNASSFPSRQDKRAFPKMGSIHLIIGHPYTYSAIRMYNYKGEPLPFEIVD